MGGKQTGYYIVGYSRLDTVSKQMLRVFLAVWKVQIWDGNYLSLVLSLLWCGDTLAILKAAGKTPLLILAL